MIFVNDIEIGFKESKLSNKLAMDNKKKEDGKGIEENKTNTNDNHEK